ncbi:MAG: hypothetical protein IJV87_01210 [Clostridia bacterium]|nr:hypothetical protein [Clostridia bacterium]
MKKIFALLIALMMVFALAACGDNNTTDPDKDNPGVSQSGNNGGSERVPSTDYFYDHYDFCEEWMMPDDGVYTGYEYISPDSNAAGNEQVNVRIYDITEEQIAAYIQKIEEHGYAHLIGDSYSKKTDFGTSMIKISKYLDDGYIIVYIDPSI